MRRGMDPVDRNSDQWWTWVLAGVVIWEEGAGEAAPTKLAGKMKYQLSS